MKLEIGKCGIDGTEIFTKVGKRYKPNHLYTEIVLMLNNGTIARHGICTKCLDTLTDEKIEVLTERIKETWYHELVGRGTDKQFEKLGKIKTEVYGRDREEVKKEYKVKKEQEKKEKLKIKK